LGGFVASEGWLDALGNAGVRGVGRGELQRLHNCFDVVFLDFYSILIDPPGGFVDLMRDLGFGDVECVVSGLRGVRCSGNYVYTPNVAYAGRFSPYRKYVSCKASVNRFVSRLFRLRDKGIDYLINIDLTVPKDFSIVYAFDGDGLKMLKKAFKLFVKRLQDSFNGELGYFYNVHIWGTKTLDPHMHIHMSMCNAVFRDGRFIRFRPYFNVETIRGLWADCLRRAGLRVDGCVDVKVRYCKLSNKAGVVHRVKYASRHPLVDIASYYADREYEGLHGTFRRWLVKLVGYVNRRVCGGFLRRLNRIVGGVKASRCCPICGGEVGRSEPISDFEGLRSDFVSGGLIIVYWDVKDKHYNMVYSSRCDWMGLLKWFDYHYNDGG
jgi:hypothetical protein